MDGKCKTKTAKISCSKSELQIFLEAQYTSPFSKDKKYFALEDDKNPPTKIEMVEIATHIKVDKDSWGLVEFAYKERAMCELEIKKKGSRYSLTSITIGEESQ